MKLELIVGRISQIGMTVATLTMIAVIISNLIITLNGDEKEFDISFVTAICNGIIITNTLVAVALNF